MKQNVSLNQNNSDPIGDEKTEEDCEEWLGIGVLYLC